MVQYAVTISPDPTTEVAHKPKRLYRSVGPRQQHNFLTHRIKVALEQTADSFPNTIVFIEGFFELNKAGQLHFHGTLSVEHEQAMQYYAQVIYDTVGRFTYDKLLQMKYKDVCCKVIPMDQVDKYRQDNNLISWYNYVRKDQSPGWTGNYPGIILQKTSRIEDFNSADLD